MKKSLNFKNGSALIIGLILSTILLIFGLGYSNLTRNTNLPTQKIDETVRLRYLADGIAQIALMKFQQYPSDFYAAYEASHSDDEDVAKKGKVALAVFCGVVDEKKVDSGAWGKLVGDSVDNYNKKENEFMGNQFDNLDDQIIAFNSSKLVNSNDTVIKKDAGRDKIDIQLVDYALLNTDTNNKATGKWSVGIISIKTRAVYQDTGYSNVCAESTLTYQITRGLKWW